MLILAKHEVNSVGSVPFPVNEHDNMMNNDHCISQVCCDNLDKLIFEFRNHIYGGFSIKPDLMGHFLSWYRSASNAAETNNKSPPP